MLYVWPSSVLEVASSPLQHRRRSYEDSDFIYSNMFFYHCRNLPLDKLLTIEKYKSLSDIDPFSVLEVESAEHRDCTSGKMGLLTCWTVNEESGVRERVKLMVPERFLVDNELTEPRVVIYTGMKKTSNGHMCHTIKVVYDDSYESGDVTMEDFANGLRTKSKIELEAMSRIYSLSKFPTGTVFIITWVRVLKGVGIITKDDVPVGNFETIFEGKTLSGEVFLPSRVMEEGKRKTPALLIYKGGRASTSGRIYHDITILDSTVADSGIFDI